MNYSTFLKDNKSTVEKIVKKLSKTFEYVSVLGVDTKGKSYNVSRTGSGINDSMLGERGFVVRVFNGSGYSEYSFNELEVNDVVKHMTEIGQREFSVEKNIYPLIEEEELVDSMENEVEVPLQDVSAAEKIEKLTSIIYQDIYRPSRRRYFPTLSNQLAACYFCQRPFHLDDDALVKIKV